MSQATTTSDEAKLPETESDYSHLYGSEGVLSMNGETIELSYSEVMNIRSALLNEAWRHRGEDRPNTAANYKTIYEVLAPAVGR